MANLDISLYLDSLKRQGSFKMFIPNDRPVESPVDHEAQSPYLARGMKTLFLLHGYTGAAGNWVPEELAQKYNFAIVMPSCENGFYLNGLSTGHAFASLVGEELVGYVRRTFGLAKTSQDTCLMGLSMGGFGALHTALAYPETFGKAAALSSALIVHEIAHMKEGDSNPVANYAYYHECFGDLESVEESDNNPETLVRKLKSAGATLPGIFMRCGTEDFLLENNREFHRFLEAEGIPHDYAEGPGTHDMKFWSACVPQAVEWMFG